MSVLEAVVLGVLLVVAVVGAVPALAAVSVQSVSGRERNNAKQHRYCSVMPVMVQVQ